MGSAALPTVSQGTDLPHPFAGATGLLATVGQTPLIELTALVGFALSARVRIFGKAEWFNPGGSVKDRAALAMVLAAERRGQLAPGGTILDASSGNTGIAYAMVAAARGYRLVLCLPSNANRERKALLAAYGATIELTSPLEGSDGAIRRAQQLASEHPEWVYLNQYGNDANWQAHFGSTGPEIWADTQGAVSHFVSALGTSGTFMGTTRYLKQRNPDIVCVAVQPDSPFHGLEGLKHMQSAIVPAIYDADIADRHLGAPTEASFEWVQSLAAQGLLVGPSGAAAVWASSRVAKELDEGVVVCVLPDSGERYLSESHLWQP